MGQNVDVTDGASTDGWLTPVVQPGKYWDIKVSITYVADDEPCTLLLQTFQTWSSESQTFGSVGYGYLITDVAA